MAKILVRNQPRFPIYITMEITPIIAPSTKPCPFCAETIQAQAIKCRFCSEFLNTQKAKALIAAADSEPEDSIGPDDVLFIARPSLWGMVGSVIRGFFFIALAYLVFIFPLEIFLDNLLGLELSDGQAITFARYRTAAALGIIVLVVLILLLKMVRLKMMRYEVTTERIEFSRGILDRKVDNLDMFRVIDISMRRSLLDCIFGIGTVGLITTDKTDPKFDFQKIRCPRRLYDIIKKASLDADKRNSVIHLE